MLSHELHLFFANCPDATSSERKRQRSSRTAPLFLRHKKHGQRQKLAEIAANFKTHDFGTLLAQQLQTNHFRVFLRLDIKHFSFAFRHFLDIHETLINFRSACNGYRSRSANTKAASIGAACTAFRGRVYQSPGKAKYSNTGRHTYQAIGHDVLLRRQSDKQRHQGNYNA